MAGEARTDLFLLATATVMVGPRANVLELTPSEHSLGLVHNFRVSTEPEFVELGQGVKNDIVSSVTVNEAVRVSMEAYEYTSKNLAYAMGLDGSQLTLGGAPIAVDSAPSGNTIAVTGNVANTFVANSFLFLQEGTGGDLVHIGKVEGTPVEANSVTTITLANGFTIPAGMTFTGEAKVGLVNQVKPSTATFQPLFGAKVVGHFPNDGRPITLIFPKMKIVRGFDIGFGRENFSNMPFEWAPYTQVPGDPTYDKFGSAKVVGFTS